MEKMDCDFTYESILPKDLSTPNPNISHTKLEIIPCFIVSKMQFHLSATLTFVSDAFLSCLNSTLSYKIFDKL